MSSDFDKEAFMYRLNILHNLFYILDNFFGHPLAKYYEKYLSLNSRVFTYEGKSSPYQHPFEIFRKRRKK